MNYCTLYEEPIDVIIPCMNRIDIFKSIIPRWFEQTYRNTNIVIVDYNSKDNIYPYIKQIADRYGVELTYNEEFSSAKCSILRVEDVSQFNMSHAINYGVCRSCSKVITVAGTETLPTPYYIDVAMTCMDHNVFCRCIRGRLTITRDAFRKINGWPEYCSFWGAEDDIVSKMLIDNGYKLRELDYFLAHNISHEFDDSLKHYEKFERNYNRGKSSKHPGAIRNVAYFMKYSQNNSTNNYGQACGAKEPMVIHPADDVSIPEAEIIQTRISLGSLPTVKTMFGSKVAVVIPCMNRSENLMATLPMWINQLYVNKQIVIVDYSSAFPIKDQVESVCKAYKCKLSCNQYDKDADVILFRVEGMEYFNISHAYNHAISRIEADVISTVCADSCPFDYYLDIVMNMVNQNTAIQIHYGLHTLTYENWKKLNGHQEFAVGWGAEDDDFSQRIELMGVNLYVISKRFVYQIEQTPEEKSKYRKIRNLCQSNLINYHRFTHYQTMYGYVANYGMPIGGNSPIDLVPTTTDKDRFYLYWIVTESLNKKNPPQDIQYCETSDVFYKLVDSGIEFVWDIPKEQITEAGRTFVIEGQSIEKIVSSIRERS